MNKKEMLNSVYLFNSRFVKTEQEKKYLKKIIKAMSVIDRKFFLDESEAYIDTAMPIGSGQTISQPSTVARMLFLADLKEKQEILEVGSGSGWNACLISYLINGKVISIERIPELAEKAKENTKKLSKNIKNNKFLKNIIFLTENIFNKKSLIWKKKYDKIIITAGIIDEKEIKNIAEKLLRKNGKLICPYQSGPLIIYEKNNKLRKTETNEEYVFVPLISDI